MIQDIAPHVLYNQYRHFTPSENDPVFCFYDEKVLIRLEDDQLTFPKVKDLDVNQEDLIYLFSLDSSHLFLYLKQTERGGHEYIDFRTVRRKSLRPKESVYALFTAYHLAGWYLNSAYCGRCGHKTVHSENERAMVCPDCGNIIYPRINPAVIVGVLHEDKMLVTKYARGYGGYALVAGFTEIGETFEETVAREVKEETGLNVRNIRYYASQPWGPAADILAGYYCEAYGDCTISVDHDELRLAEWKTRDEIVLQENDYSLTNEMMRNFKEGKI